MRIETRINYQKYFILTGISTGICLLFARHLDDVMGILVVYIAAFINQVFLVRVVREAFMPNDEQQNAQVDKWRVTRNFLGKLAILALGLTLGVHFMGNRIIIPVLNYVFQIFALALSLKSPTESGETLAGTSNKS